MDQREILNFGPGCFEVWDYWGNRVFEGSTLQECQDWIANNPVSEEDSD